MAVVLSSAQSWKVTNYVNYARTLLQDTVDSPYRYSTTDLVRSLNIALGEMRKLRPDLFPGGDFPIFDGAGNDTDVVPVDAMYFMPIVMFMVGYAQLRDDEEVQDQRAAAFLAIFQAKLTTVS